MRRVTEHTPSAACQTALPVPQYSAALTDAFWACLSRLPGKRARPVLRGRWRSNAPPLPDWKPVFYLLEAHGLDPWLVNARDVKHLPGRPKSDVIDAVWLCKLAERQMLRPSFVPPCPIRRLRDLTRYRVRIRRREVPRRQSGLRTSNAGVYGPCTTQPPISRARVTCDKACVTSPPQGISRAQHSQDTPKNRRIHSWAGSAFPVKLFGDAGDEAREPSGETSITAGSAWAGAATATANIAVAERIPAVIEIRM